jgi:hypothetical protein
MIQRSCVPSEHRPFILTPWRFGQKRGCVVLRSVGWYLRNESVRMELTEAISSQAGNDERNLEGPSRAIRAGLVAIAILPVVVAAIRSIGRDWFPIGDSALLYLRTADVFTRHHPFLGSWTSASVSVGENMNNPGPTYNFLIAPFAHLFASGPGAAIGVGAVNVASIIGISWASRRIGGWPMQRWMLVAAAALAWSMGSELLIDIWQAHALLLPFLFFLVLLTGCSAGNYYLLPATVGVATLLIQTHITYAYILILLILISFATFWMMHRPVGRVAPIAVVRSRPVVLSTFVILVLWAHPIWEQFFGDGRGNLARLVANSSGGAVTVGWTDATRITAAVTTVPWWWMRRDFSNKIRYEGGYQLILPSVFVSVASLLVLVALLAALTCASHRRGLTVQTIAGVLATMSVPATIASLSRLTIGPTLLSSGHVRWAWTVAVFVTFVAVWLAVDLRTSSKSRKESQWPTAVAVASLIALSFANLGYTAYSDGPHDYAAMPALRRALPRVSVLADHDPVLFNISNLRLFEPYSSTVMMRMRELGIEFRVADEGFVRQLGPNRRADGSERTTVFQLEGAWALTFRGEAAPLLPAACTIALTSALSEEEELRAEAAALELAAALGDGTIRVDADQLPEDDPLLRWVLGAAVAGDLEAGWPLVIDGTLAGWLASGVAVSSSPGTAEQVDLVTSWVQSAYGLFVEGLDPCPAIEQRVFGP